VPGPPGLSDPSVLRGLGDQFGVPLAELLVRDVWMHGFLPWMSAGVTHGRWPLVFRSVDPRSVMRPVTGDRMAGSVHGGDAGHPSARTQPSVVRSGQPQPPPRGRKVWALLAYLLITESAPGRDWLSELLFSNADGPTERPELEPDSTTQTPRPESSIGGEHVVLRPAGSDHSAAAGAVP
jgi:hypothetical protein